MRWPSLFELLKVDYFTAGAAGVVVVVVASAGATSFLTFFALLAFLTFFTSFFSTLTSPAGLVVVVSDVTSVLTVSVAKTTAEKDMATIAATIVERTFFILNLLVQVCVDCRCLLPSMTDANVAGLHK